MQGLVRRPDDDGLGKGLHKLYSARYARLREPHRLAILLIDKTAGELHELLQLAQGILHGDLAPLEFDQEIVFHLPVGAQPCRVFHHDPLPHEVGLLAMHEPLVLRINSSSLR